jgi:hypothetical protein
VQVHKLIHAELLSSRYRNTARSPNKATEHVDVLKVSAFPALEQHLVSSSHIQSSPLDYLSFTLPLLVMLKTHEDFPGPVADAHDDLVPRTEIHPV